MIELREVSKIHGEKPVVDRVSFQVHRGEVLVLLGGSGSGKTTTLRMINRLVEPSSGAILIDGQDVATLPAHQHRRRIGYVFQRIGLFPHLTVAENIGVTPSLLGWDAERIRARVDELLPLVELDRSLRDRWPDQLSGGQAQRVAVARALAASPPILLLDEPFGALDPLTRERLQRSFRALQKRLELTAIFVTHDVFEALALGDRIAVLHEGHLLQIGPPQDLLKHPESPYIEDLFRGPLLRAREAIDALGALG